MHAELLVEDEAPQLDRALEGGGHGFGDVGPRIREGIASSLDGSGDLGVRGAGRRRRAHGHTQGPALRSVGEHLEPGGVAQFLGNWEIRRGADWRDRWRDWLAGTGLDAWVIQRDVQDPAEYAELYATDHHSIDDVFWKRMLAEYDQREVVELSMCIGSWLSFGRLNRILGLDTACVLPSHVV